MTRYSLKMLCVELWRGLRHVSGDDAYDRYLSHWQQAHAAEGQPPLSRRAYARQQIAARWSGVRRCC